MIIRYTLRDAQNAAFYNGGKCLSKEFIDLYSPLKWKCSQGHTWDADFAVVRQGSWCIQCVRHEDKRLRLEKLKGIAAMKGGKCLSEAYIDRATKLKFECRYKHSWMTAPANILHGSWCPKCAGKAKPEIEELQQFAAGKRGKLLSKRYVNNWSNLKWQCKEGHVWKAAWSGVKHGGTWCPHCYGNIVHTLDDVQRFAKSKGGKCLSKTYRNNRQILLFECKKEHQWKASAHTVFNGSWCPYCAGKGKRSIKDMQKLAATRNGKCLSAVYHGSKSKLKWQCDKGHIWKTTPDNVVSGYWCPVCGKLRSKETRRRNRLLKNPA